MTSAITPQHTADADPLQDLLWHDEQILFDRHLKTTAGLIALQRVLSSQLTGLPAVREFLALLDLIGALPGTAFTRVWTEPAAYYWVRTAYQMTGQHLNPEALPAALRAYLQDLGETDIERALCRHLHRFKAFVLGACHAAGCDIHFDTPLIESLPFPLPGTPFYIQGNGEIAIDGLTADAIEIGHDGKRALLSLAMVGENESNGLSLRRCPVVDLGDAEILMLPAALDWPGVDFIAPARDAGMQYQFDRVDMLSSTLKLIERYAPESFTQLSGYLHNIVFKPLTPGVYSNLSHSDFPGMAILGFYDNAPVLADALIHELHHNRLFCIEERGAFFSDPDHLEDAGYYSPWREEPRPLHGLLHAVYVHLPVADFWLNLLADADCHDERVRALARDRVMRICLQCRIGIVQLERFADRLTDFGRRIVTGIKARLQTLQAGLPTEITPTVPAIRCKLDGDIDDEKCPDGMDACNVTDVVLEHIRRYDVRRQCSDLLSGGALAARE